MRFLYFAKKYAAWSIFALISLISLGFMLYASYSESGTMDELAHIPAGYGYVRYLDFRLNPEHPPLVKALSALPLLFLRPNFPDTHSSWQNDVNSQWEAGSEFLYHSGNNADRIIRLARFAPILLTLLLILFIYLWAKESMGNIWGLLPTALFALSPSVIAHGHYVTTDIGAALGIFGGTYYFTKYLKYGGRKPLWHAGIAFGIAQLMKFSAVLLIPFFLVLAAFYALASRKNQVFKNAILITRNTIFVFLIGYILIVYPMYTIFTARYPIEKQATDTEFILGSFADGPTQEGTSCRPMRCLAEIDIWMSKNPIFRPAGEYLLGVLMVIQRSAGGNTGYFLGIVSAAGSHLYFPAVYLMKEPLSTLVIVLIAFVASIIRIGKALKRNSWMAVRAVKEYMASHFDAFAMILFVLLYWAYSIQSPLNIGFRHLFPAIPFMYVLAARTWKKLVLEDTNVTSDVFPHQFGKFFKNSITQFFTIAMRGGTLLILLVWLITETIIAAPYFLSYFNPLFGGATFGYRYVTDSNYDWGQDLLRLRSFVETHPEIKKIAVDYFGAGDTKYYLGEKAEYWWSARGNPIDESIGWFAVSINNLQSTLQPAALGFERKKTDEYRWLTELRTTPQGIGNVPEPDFRIGTSIFVYKLGKDSDPNSEH